MSGMRILKSHRSWEDWAAMILGVLIVVSPWFADRPHGPGVVANAVIIGLLVLALAQLEYVRLRRWQEIGLIACGLWLAVSPYTFRYAATGTLRYWHVGFGALVILMAALELWQDRKLSDRELAQHSL